MNQYNNAMAYATIINSNKSKISYIMQQTESQIALLLLGSCPQFDRYSQINQGKQRHKFRVCLLHLILISYCPTLLIT